MSRSTRFPATAAPANRPPWPTAVPNRISRAPPQAARTVGAAITATTSAPATRPAHSATAPGRPSAANPSAQPVATARSAITVPAARAGRPRAYQRDWASSPTPRTPA
ncbi:hypothetical protein Acsp05_54950 [Actinokineospora sp. NBRC 105648]|nr:hypothetical protein Acsp05_54950 [Actinokineospora sp. NBRC 105648]